MVNRNLIKLCIILLLIGLIGYVYITSRNLNCNQCTVSFSNSKIGYALTYNMTDLYKEAQKEDCPIYWDRVRGYVQG
jgi:hypothetical protein